MDYLVISIHLTKDYFLLINKQIIVLKVIQYLLRIKMINKIFKIRRFLITKFKKRFNVIFLVEKKLKKMKNSKSVNSKIMNILDKI